MSLSVDGVWKAGVWATTVWADGVWREGAPQPTPEVVTSGGGKKKRYARYPRRILMDGRLYTAHSAEDERRLLQAFLDRARETAASEPPEIAAETMKRAVRIQKRIEKAAERETQWMRRLQEMDEELLILLT